MSDNNNDSEATYNSESSQAPNDLRGLMRWMNGPDQSNPSGQASESTDHATGAHSPQSANGVDGVDDAGSPADDGDVTTDVTVDKPHQSERAPHVVEATDATEATGATDAAESSATTPNRVEEATDSADSADSADGTNAADDAVQDWAGALAAFSQPAADTSAQEAAAPGTPRAKRTRGVSRRLSRAQSRGTGNTQDRVVGPLPAHNTSGAAASPASAAGLSGPSRSVLGRSVLGAGAVLAIAAAVLGGRALMGDSAPVSTTADQVVRSTAVDTPAAPATTATSVANKGLPAADVSVYAGTCSADQLDELTGGSGAGSGAGSVEQISPSGKSLRSAIADFQGNYFTKNVEGLRATIDEQNKPWRDQDWNAVLTQIPDDASWCLVMAPEQAGSVLSTVVMSQPGEPAVTFASKVRGSPDTSGRWKVTEMTSIS